MEACTAKLRTVLQEELSPRALLLSAAQLIKEKNIDKAVLLLEVSRCMNAMLLFVKISCFVP